MSNQHLRFEQDGHQAWLNLSQDFQEGVRAFLDKRKPAWQGR